LINLFIYSEEVKKELPDESEEFVGIDKEVKKILKMVDPHPNIVDFCTVTDENNMTVIKRLELVERDLAKCQKGLNDF
jgi:dynein heavy chain